MENNVVSLETAKKLKAAGFLQMDTYWYYRFDKLQRHDACKIDESILPNSLKTGKEFWDNDYTQAAPTAQEIADQMAGELELKLGIAGWMARSGDVYGEISGPDTMAEALAALRLKLNQKGEE